MSGKHPTTHLLRWYFNGYDEMVKRYPKAAKKKRVRKKWLARFGEPIDWSAELQRPSFLESVATPDDFRGAYFQLPFGAANE